MTISDSQENLKLQKRRQRNREYYYRNREKYLTRAKQRYREDAEHRARMLRSAKEWDRKNPEARHQYWQNRKAKRREQLAALKDRPCEDCGVKYPPRAMDFHHPNGDGHKFSFGTRTWEAVMEEVRKCVLLCANCHRLRHG